MPAYYNEFDPYAAQWLRNLIAAGHLAPGDVDTRSIVDVQAEELAPYDQCHFFAGIGVWGHALRSIGWPDVGPIWTGSCPCQPFSAAGKQLGTDDPRHLWPAWFRLIEQRRPAIVVGEQVASALAWLDIVSNDLETAGYAVGAADLCAAGYPVEGWHESPQHEWLLRAVRDCPDPVVREQLFDFAAWASGNLGAHDGDHIRQRLYFVAFDGLVDGEHAGLEGRRERLAAEGGRLATVRPTAATGGAGGLADAEREQRNGRRAGEAVHEPGAVERDARLRAVSGLADPQRNDGRPIQPVGGPEGRTADGRDSARLGERPATHAPDSGRGAADWLYCRDGKWRPVEPGTFPLVNAAPARVGRLRAYGNALDKQTVVEFLTVVKELAP